MRKICSIGGAIAGVVYTLLAMMAIYRHLPPGVTVGFGTMALRFFLFSLFTAPLGAAVGLGIGLLLEGLRKK